MKLLLVKLKRDYHNHDYFHDSVKIALENLLSDIITWQHENGVFFECELIEYPDYAMNTNVTAVVAKFATTEDYAWYKLSMGNEHKVATEFTESHNGSVVFTNWKKFNDKAEIC